MIVPMDKLGPSTRAGGKALFTIFEVSNETRREIYVGMTDLPMFQATQLLRASPPRCLAHWRGEEPHAARSIEFDLSREDARRFIDHYVKTALPPGWRFLRE